MWLDDTQHGIGSETWNDKSSFFGIYDSGKKHGIGLFYVVYYK